MQNLKEIREKIDLIDTQLVMLLVQRLALAKDVALIKKETGGAVCDPLREQQLLDRLSALAGTENAAEIRAVYATLLTLSKTRQRAFLECDVSHEGGKLVGKKRGNQAV